MFGVFGVPGDPEGEPAAKMRVLLLRFKPLSLLTKVITNIMMKKKMKNIDL